MKEAQTAAQQEAKIRFSQDGITMNGVPVIVLCSSLFYFRIPRGLWRDRLRKVKEAGYNCIDVYVPWNYHESEPGQWDFSGERDVEAFLQEAADEGLWIVARPGPYICSEWDGGALPAYLMANRAMRLRDNDPVYLQAVRRWFDKVMPILKRFELGQGGTVIAVQLENELDFYDCREPEAYIAALRDMALDHGITVPLFACAGQGELHRAAGSAEGVMPTCNFYPNDKDPEFEEKAIAYYEELQSRGYPLLVTETNRSHFLLRRLLASGAKLLGPYLQTSGTNFGFYNAINNWGKPLAFLTSDYDFYGMITPTGKKRSEFYEGQLLSGLLDALAEDLACAAPVASFLAVDTELTVTTGMKHILKLGKQGYLLSLPNVDGMDGTITLEHPESGSRFPQYTQFTLAADRCPLLLYDYPLERWGIRGTLRYTTAELLSVSCGRKAVSMTFYADTDAELALELGEALSVPPAVQRSGTDYVFCFSKGSESRMELELAEGLLLEIVFLPREQAVRLHEEQQQEKAPTDLVMDPWRLSTVPVGGRELPAHQLNLGDSCRHLEEAGIYRGFAWYEAERAGLEHQQVLGLLVQDAGDVLSIYSDEGYAGTLLPGGGTAFLPLSSKGHHKNLTIRSEIWGHTNFDDNALPGLRMNSLKGLSGAIYVTSRRELSRNWTYQHESTLPEVDTARSSAVVDWGSWMSSCSPERGMYHKTLTASPEADAWVLHLPDVQCRIRVYIDASFAGEVHPLNPYVDVTSFVSAGAQMSISLSLERYYHQPAGKVVLYEGQRATSWRVGGCGEEQLWTASLDAEASTASCELPVSLAAGSVAWLMADMPPDVTAACRYMACKGRNVKVTAFFNGHLVGRIWTEGDLRPYMTGGAQNLIYLPEPWYHEGGNRLALLVEAVGDNAELTELVFERQ
jgi:beta-galactosidase